MDPLHITEFASERYFSKLKQLRSNEDNGSSSTQPAAAADVSLPPPIQPATFTLPLGNPRFRHDELEPPHLRPSDQKKRSLGHDLTSLRTTRRPSFSGSFGRLHSKVNVIHKTPTIVEHREQILAEKETDSLRCVLSPLYRYNLANLSVAWVIYSSLCLMSFKNISSLLFRFMTYSTYDWCQNHSTPRWSTMRCPLHDITLNIPFHLLQRNCIRYHLQPNSTFTIFVPYGIGFMSHQNSPQ